MKKIVTLLLAGMIALSGSLYAKETKNDFKVATSLYVGWLPWYFAADKGILDKHAKANGINVKLDIINDYIESLNLYTSGSYDAVTVTNMDNLSIPALSGIKSKALIIGDYSNGNDGIVLKSIKTIKEAKGKRFYLVEYSVSHYLLARTLQKNGMSERDVQVVSTNESDILTVYLTSSEKAGVVTWNPWLAQTLNDPKSTQIASSADIPYEILDLMVVNEKTSDPRFEKTLRDTWAEILDITTNPANPRHGEMLSYMAGQSQATVAEIKSQLKTTHFFSAKEEAEFRTSKKLTNTMKLVSQFLFDKGLYGNLKDVKDIGIQTGDTVIGNKNTIRLTF